MSLDIKNDTTHSELNSLRIDRSKVSANKSTSLSPKRKWIVLSLGVLLLVAGTLTYRLSGISAAEVGVTRVQSPVSSASGTVLSAAGYIVAHHKIDVNSKVTGRVAWIGVEESDKVQAGQVLVRLEDQEFRAAVDEARGAVNSAAAQLAQLENGSRPEEIKAAFAGLEEARATLATDRVTLERTKTLAEQGIASRQQLDEAQAKYGATLQRVGALEQTWKLAQLGPRSEEIQRQKGLLEQAQGHLSFTLSQLEATQIRAPITGTILERTAEKGELVTAQFASAADTGGPRGSVVSLADLSDLQVELDISQSDFARLLPEQRAVITTDAFPAREYTGAIVEISPEANRQKATVQVKVKISAPDSYLRPDMNANVRFLADASRNSMPTAPRTTIPVSAVRDHGTRKVVMIAYNGRALEREVKIISQSGQEYMVEGLFGGEDVIVKGSAKLKDEDPISIRD